MAQYKVPQDVEAEDKLLGPLTLKQFLFAIAFCGLLYLTYLIFLANPFFSLITLPLLIVTGAFAFWQRKDQPVEVFFRAGILFYTRPHIRKWDQDGALKLVEVLVPKKVVKYYTDGRSATDVKSQLNQLSSILDTRGWNNRMGGQESMQSERLVPLEELPTASSVRELTEASRVVDTQESNSSIAREVQRQIEQSTGDRKQQVHAMIESQINNLSTNTPGAIKPQVQPSSETPVNPNLTISSIAQQVEPEPVIVPPVIESQKQQRTAIANYAKIAQAQTGSSIRKNSTNVLEEGQELELR